MRDSFLFAVLPTAFLLWGCSGGSGGTEEQQGGIAQSTALVFHGIYAVTSHTENIAGCDSEGPSVLETQSENYALITSSLVLSNRVVWFVSCSEPAECRDKADAVAQQANFLADLTYWLSSEVSATQLTGFLASTGTFDNGACTDRTYSDLSLAREDGDGLRLEVRTKLLSDRPPEDGFCVVRPAESENEAATLPCSSLEAISAVQSDEL